MPTIYLIDVNTLQYNGISLNITDTETISSDIPLYTELEPPDKFAVWDKDHWTDIDKLSEDLAKMVISRYDSTPICLPRYIEDKLDACFIDINTLDPVVRERLLRKQAIRNRIRQFRVNHG